MCWDGSRTPNTSTAVYIIAFRFISLTKISSVWKEQRASINQVNIIWLWYAHSELSLPVCVYVKGPDLFWPHPKLDTEVFLLKAHYLVHVIHNYIFSHLNRTNATLSKPKGGGLCAVFVATACELGLRQENCTSLGVSEVLYWIYLLLNTTKHVS